uniref:Uncharacterized protein n=1 Tax=Arundo donax TaxID=35708 RepID=A0A0A8YPM2_ARUDO
MDTDIKDPRGSPWDSASG